MKYLGTLVSIFIYSLRLQNCQPNSGTKSLYSTWITLPKPPVVETSVASIMDQREYKKMFPDENFINAKSPLQKNDHPELDNSELCNEEQITNMCMIGQLQWAITLGRYEFLAQVM